MEIIIDGYNLLKASASYQPKGDDWERARNRLIKGLQKYQSYKKHKITVVFDGWKNGFPVEHREKEGAINIIFSRQGEKADEVIKRMVLKGTGSPLVITSDREIIQAVERAGAHFLGSAEFDHKLQIASYPGIDDEVEPYDESLDRPISTRKKGNPRRRSRKERQRGQRLKKL